MTAFCAYNSPKLTPDGNGYAGDNAFPPNSVTLVGTGALECSASTNGVTVDFRGGALQTQVITSSSPTTLAPNTQYILDAVTAVMTLPPVNVSGLGDIITIVNLSGAWTLGKNTSNQNINIGNMMTSGNGNLSGDNGNEVITIMCVQPGAPERWVSYNVTGNITIT
jgi:hypothetical protein